MHHREWLAGPLLSLVYGCGVTQEPDRATAANGEEREAQPLVAAHLRCEQMIEPRGVGERRPLLSWTAQAAPDDRHHGRRISAWRVKAAGSREALEDGELSRWDSGRIEGDALHAIWGGAPLSSRAEVWWSVELWDERGQLSSACEPASFTVGLFDEPGASDWSAAWIGAADAATPARTVSPWLVHDVKLPGAVRRLRVWVASLGSHQLWLDGRRLGDPRGDIEFAPGMVDFSRRTRVVEYDLESALAEGDHRLGLWLHSGFARHEPFHVAAHPLVCAQFEFELLDGRRIPFSTGADWRAAPSSVTAIGGFEPGDYGGEQIDATRDALRWCDPLAAKLALDAAVEWQPVALYSPSITRLALACPPDRRRDALKPVAIDPVARADATCNAWRVDFGRAFNGSVEARLRGAPFATVVLEMGERFDEPSSWGQRAALLLNEQGRGTFTSRFQPVAGRWLTITGTSDAPTIGDVTAALVRPDFERTGTFRCSDPRVQRLHDTAAWTYECLVLGGAPQDCPHRERFGYGGDAHATMSLGLGSFDTAAIYSRWLDDWAALQSSDGDLPFTCPTLVGGGGPAWSGIVVLLAWEHWLRTGDRRTLERAWPAIARWLAFLETHTRAGLLEPDPAPKWVVPELAWLDDWLAPGSDPHPSRFDERSAFFQNAYRVGCVRRAAELARALGRNDEAATLAARANTLADAVHDRFWDRARGFHVARDTVNVLLALFAGIGDIEVEDRLVARLYERIESGAPIDTGLHGTWLLVRELLARGRADLLLKLAQQDGVPSFQGLLAGDATTLGETWEGRFSRIHACWLSIGALAPEGILGIRPRLDAPGYRAFDVTPLLDAGIASASGSIATPYGTVALSWSPLPQRAGTALQLSVPVGSTALLSVRLGDGVSLRLRDGERDLSIEACTRTAGSGIRAVERSPGRVRLEVGSGHYTFERR